MMVIFYSAEDYRHAEHGPRDDGGASRMMLVIGRREDLEAPDGHRQHDFGLHQREVVANAELGPDTERHKRLRMGARAGDAMLICPGLNSPTSSPTDPCPGAAP